MVQGTRCPEFQSSLIYQVALLGSSVVAVNHTSCGEVCIISFQNFSDAFDEYRVSLFAENAIGISEVLEFPTMIGIYTICLHNYYIAQLNACSWKILEDLDQFWCMLMHAQVIIIKFLIFFSKTKPCLLRSYSYLK